jgi:hypothetical protein
MGRRARPRSRKRDRMWYDGAGRSPEQNPAMRLPERIAYGWFAANPIDRSKKEGDKGRGRKVGIVEVGRGLLQNLLTALGRLNWLFALLLAVAAAFVFRSGQEEGAAIIWLVSLIILLPLWRQPAPLPDILGLDPDAGSIKQPDDQSHNYNQAEDAAQPPAAVASVGVIPAAAAEQQNQNNDDQK